MAQPGGGVDDSSVPVLLRIMQDVRHAKIDYVPGHESVYWEDGQGNAGVTSLETALHCISKAASISTHLEITGWRHPEAASVEDHAWTCTACEQPCTLQLVSDISKFMSSCCTASVRPTKENNV